MWNPIYLHYTYPAPAFNMLHPRIRCGGVEICNSFPSLTLHIAYKHLVLQQQQFLHVANIMYDTCFCSIRPKEEDIYGEEDSVLHPTVACSMISCTELHPSQYDAFTACTPICAPSSRNGRDRESWCAYPHIDYVAPMTSVGLTVCWLVGWLVGREGCSAGCSRVKWAE